ncbi:unnamed protein product [Meloidogyne enterolobii]|uniref:Uncharacterized protein n=1 Tax=Meloidogyne enterolobii TaxID=390850 RepID=A0ACB1AWA9_MELEN
MLNFILKTGKFYEKGCVLARKLLNFSLLPSRFLNTFPRIWPIKLLKSAK